MAVPQRYTNQINHRYFSIRLLHNTAIQIAIIALYRWATKYAGHPRSRWMVRRYARATTYLSKCAHVSICNHIQRRDRLHSQILLHMRSVTLQPQQAIGNRGGAYLAPCPRRS